MADEGQGADEGTTTGGAEPQGSAEPDYKALYERAKADASKWSARARENKAAADELAKAKEAGKTADERIADLTQRLDAKEKAERRAALAAKVAREKGVPADLLSGDTEEEMAAWADKMAAHYKAKPAPEVGKPGAFARGEGGRGSAKADFAAFMAKQFR